MRNTEHNTPPATFLMPISGKDEMALRMLVERYISFLEKSDNATNLADICYTASIGRSHFDHRLAVIASNKNELVVGLKEWFAGAAPKNVFQATVPSNRDLRVAFLCTGQGAQYIGMGQQLYNQEPVFRAAIDQCNSIFTEYHTSSLLDVLYPSEEQTSPIDETTYTQAALFSIEYALGQLWKHWGVSPSVLLGHSVGEYAAGCLAGVFSLEDGMKLIVHRGKLMGSLPREGGMMSIYAARHTVEPLLAEFKNTLSVAAENSPTQTVISGVTTSLNALESKLKEKGIKTIRLEVSHAFHSELMQPMVAAFREVAEQVIYHEPTTPMVSLVTGKLAGAEIATADYWVNHILAPVSFRSGMEALQALAPDVYLEIGPHPILLALGMACVQDKTSAQWLASLKRQRGQQVQLPLSPAELYVHGAKVRWSDFYPEKQRKVQLPTYPFQRSRYWVETAAEKEAILKKDGLLHLLGANDITALSGELQSEFELGDADAEMVPKLLESLKGRFDRQSGSAALNGLLYSLNWEQETLVQNQDAIAGNWLVFSDKEDKLSELIAALRKQGANTIEVQAETANTQEIVSEALANGITGIVYGRSLDLTLDASSDALQNEIDAFLILIQELAKSNSASPKLWVLTNNGQQVAKTDVVVPNQTTVSGLAAVLRNEMPQLQAALIDFDANAEALLPEFTTKAKADRVSYREGKRFIARLRLTKPTTKASAFNTSKEGSYLITGGTGALGLATAKWLAKKGAGEIVLLSRSGGSVAQSTLDNLAKLGAKVSILKGDVSNVTDMDRIFKTLDANPFSLKGIIHAAGVVEDGLLSNQNSEKFQKVLQPKAQGGWLLHERSKEKDLDFFICYSSAASLLGFAGQGNYAAANSYLEGLTHYRRSLGLPATVINWGPWKEGGMAGALSEKDQLRMKRLGVSLLETPTAFQALENCFTAGTAATGVIAIEWEKYAKEIGGTQPFLQELLSKKEDARESQILVELKNAPRKARAKIVFAFLEKTLANILGVANGHALNRQKGFAEMGIDSLMAVELKKRLENELEIGLSPTLAFSYPNLTALKDYLLETLGLDEVELRANTQRTTQSINNKEPIAIIGMGCRFPGGANNPEAFWELLRNGVDAIKEVPSERWNVDDYYDEDPEKPGKIYTRFGGFIDQVDEFDSKFFGITPNEADYIDPQQRLLLEVAWEAIENAGIPASNLSNSSTGVFIGIGQNDYGQHHLENTRMDDINAYTGTGNSYSFAAGRLSYFLGVEGPSISIDTACSSSLVTVNMACQSLLNGESDYAIAGGVQLMLTPQSSRFLSKSKALSPDGRC